MVTREAPLEQVQDCFWEVSRRTTVCAVTVFN
jgi:hypothetical protein